MCAQAWEITLFLQLYSSGEAPRPVPLPYNTELARVMGRERGGKQTWHKYMHYIHISERIVGSSANLYNNPESWI